MEAARSFHVFGEAIDRLQAHCSFAFDVARAARRRLIGGTHATPGTSSPPELNVPGLALGD
jgi:hypothetical protein